MSHIWMSHVTYLNESCPSYGWVMAQSMCVAWFINKCAVSHSQRWVAKTKRHKLACSRDQNYVTHVNTYEWVTSYMWTIHITRMKESCHTYKRIILTSHGTKIHETCHVSMYKHTNQLLIKRPESCHIYERVMSHTWMSHVTLIDESFTHMNESRHTYERVVSHIFRGS